MVELQSEMPCQEEAADVQEQPEVVELRRQLEEVQGQLEEAEAQAVASKVTQQSLEAQLQDLRVMVQEAKDAAEQSAGMLHTKEEEVSTLVAQADKYTQELSDVKACADPLTTVWSVRTQATASAGLETLANAVCTQSMVPEMGRVQGPRGRRIAACPSAVAGVTESKGASNQL